MTRFKQSRLTWVPKILRGSSCRFKLYRGGIADQLRLVYSWGLGWGLGTELVPYKA